MREDEEIMRLEEEEDRVEGVGLSSRCWRRRETSGIAPSVTAYTKDDVKQESNEQSWAISNDNSPSAMDTSQPYLWTANEDQ